MWQVFPLVDYDEWFWVKTPLIIPTRNVERLDCKLFLSLENWL